MEHGRRSSRSTGSPATDEVTEYLRRTLGKKKVIVLGHSWGSIVAVDMVKRRPDLFAAYVGTGQVASWEATSNLQFDLALSKARQDGDAAAIAKLKATGRPDPNDPKRATIDAIDSKDYRCCRGRSSSRPPP